MISASIFLMCKLSMLSGLVHRYIANKGEHADHIPNPLMPGSWSDFSPVLF